MLSFITPAQVKLHHQTTSESTARHSLETPGPRGTRIEDLTKEGVPHGYETEEPEDRALSEGPENKSTGAGAPRDMGAQSGRVPRRQGRRGVSAGGRGLACKRDSLSCAR